MAPVTTALGCRRKVGQTMRYAALLRGINLGRRRVTGDELRAPFERAGFSHVTTFLASGNVAFETETAGEPAELELRIETALLEGLGYQVATFVRTWPQLADVVSAVPFDDELIAQADGKAQVTFLRELPTADAVADAQACGSVSDRIAVVGREWYWLPSQGVSGSALDLRAVETALGRGTTRTLRTVERFVAKHGADD